MNDKCEIEFWEDKIEEDYKKDYINLKNKFNTLLQAYKNISKKYTVLFKEFEKEVLKLDPDFKFE